MKVLALLRHPRFSPNSVEKDEAIMRAVAVRLREKGHEVTMESEAQWQQQSCDCVLTMGRLPETLGRLEGMKVPVINSSAAIRNCARSTLAEVMLREGIPAAPREGCHGYWLKRGDACAQEQGDVVFASNEAELEARIGDFRQRGITDYVVSAHVEGDVVKFYGVRGTGFFRYFYPTDDGQTKFGDEAHNGKARHYAFSVESMQQAAERLAVAIGLDVYGGDCIVRADGTFCIIDFNDWPSFSRCREEAAEAIASLVQ